MPSTVARAYQLLNAGRRNEALAALEAGAAAGDSDCLVELAVWHLEGAIVPRDLKRARDLFRRAGEAGHRRAMMVHVSLLGNGTGGPRDWSGAQGLLRTAAHGDPDAARLLGLLERMQLTDDGDPRSVPEPKRLSDAPDVRLFPGLLNEEECGYLIDSASPLLAPSVVVDPATGRMVPNPVRTSDGAAFPWVDENPVIHAINRRIAAAGGVDVATGEPLQVLRYRPGQEYRPHHDALPNTDNQRILTMLVYLNDGYEGGETIFLKTGLRVKGALGDALLFRNADARGRPDPNAQHAGLPVLAGEKLIASRWIHEKRFGPL